MDVYTYCVQDGQFTIEFKAPLLGKEGDVLTIYDFMNDEIIELREVKIHTIDKVAGIIECTSNVS